MFKNALAAIQSPASIPFLVLLSTDGICLGDICFAKIQTTLHMRTVSLTVLERWIENGSFNPEHKAEGEYSHSTAILIILNPNNQGTGLKCMSIGLIVWQCNGQVGKIDDIPKLIAYAHSQLQGDGHSSDNAHQTFCIIVGDYGGTMGFATDLPFCTAYPLSLIDKEDSAWMTFRNPQNHPASFTADVLLLHQLLAQDCSPREYAEDRCRRYLIIPWGLHFSSNLFPQIIFPATTRHHTTTPGQEEKLHFSPWVRSQARTRYFPAQLGI